MSYKKGILIIISGFSGAGKGTIVKRLLEDDQYALSVSATTRDAREGEIDGKDYHFISMEAFESMIKANDLIEYATYVGNYYGTPKSFVLEQLNTGKDVILEIEMQGALQVKKQFEDALMVFITAPTALEIKQRLINRGTESLELIQKRLEKSLTEIDAIDDYDYILINDGLEDTVDELNDIIRIEHERVKRNKDLKGRLRKEFEELLKGE